MVTVLVPTRATWSKRTYCKFWNSKKSAKKRWSWFPQRFNCCHRVAGFSRGKICQWMLHLELLPSLYMAIYLGHLQPLTSMIHIRCSTKFAANLNFQVKNHAPLKWLQNYLNPPQWERNRNLQIQARAKQDARLQAYSMILYSTVRSTLSHASDKGSRKCYPCFFQACSRRFRASGCNCTAFRWLVLQRPHRYTLNKINQYVLIGSEHCIKSYIYIHK